MNFTSPEFLLFGVGIVALVVFGFVSYARRRKQLATFFGGRDAGARLAAENLHAFPWARVLLLILAASGAAISGAEPRWIARDPGPAEPTPIRETIVAIDVSASMQAIDAPQSRLARAVEITEALLEVVSERDRVGLLLFAGHGYPLAPPTEDRDALRYLISGIVPTIASAHDPGTLHSNAIRDAESLFDSDPEVPTDRAIVVIGDGEAGEPDGQALSAVRDAMEGGLRVHAIGVGSVEGAGLVMPAAPYQLGGVVVDAERRPVVSRLREQSLVQIAAAGGGRYARADDGPALEELFSQLASLELAVGTGADLVEPPRDPAPLFAFMALLLLLTDSLFDLRLRRRRTPGTRGPG